MTKEELKKELEGINKLYVVGIKRGSNPKWDKGIWQTFRIFYFKDNEIKEIVINENEKDKPTCWNEKKKIFESRVLGSDRVFEIIYELGRWLFNDGYKFKGIFLSYDF